MMTDPIADLLTRIRNAQRANHEKVLVSSSRIHLEILRILRESGYIGDYHLLDDRHRSAEVELRYHQGEPVITDITRRSTPGRRVYVKSDEIPEVLGGLGLAILSTSHGLMSGKDAQQKRLGGELICTVY